MGENICLNFILKKNPSSDIPNDTDDPVDVVVCPEDDDRDDLDNVLAGIHEKRNPSVVTMQFMWDSLDAKSFRIYDIQEIAMVIIEKVCAAFPDAAIHIQDARFGSDAVSVRRWIQKLPPKVRKTRVRGHYLFTHPNGESTTKTITFDHLGPDQV